MNIALVHKACSDGNLSTLQTLISQSPELIDSLDVKDGWTPLNRAIICGHHNVAKFLLKQGANPSSTSLVGEPPLYLAIDMLQVSLVQLLLDFGAESNCANADGETPLHLATFKGDLRLMEMLLEHGADPNVQDLVVLPSQFERTPMHIAMEKTNEEAVQLLLRYDASTLIADKRKELLSKSASPLSSSRSTQISQFQDLRESQFQRVPERDPSHGSSRSASAERGRRTLHDRIGEIDQLNQKIRSVLKANDALPGNQSVVITEATYAEPDSEKVNTSQNLSHLGPGGFSFGRDSEVGKGLGEWLHDIRLDEILEKLLESGFDDVEEMVAQQNSEMRLTPTILRDIGIEKPGHRYILLAALELENDSVSLPVKKPRHNHTYSCFNPVTYPSSLPSCPSLQQWLSSLNLENYLPLFTSAGFPHFDQMVALMHTSFKLTEKVLETDVGITKLGHRHRILGSLQEAAKDADPARLLFTNWGQRLTHKLRRSERDGQNQSCEVMCRDVMLSYGDYRLAGAFCNMKVTDWPRFHFVTSLYCIGSSECDQSGIPFTQKNRDVFYREGDDSQPILNVPRILDTFSLKKTVCQLVCGGLHSLALLSNGELWAWGCSDNGVLGFTGDGVLPQRVPIDSVVVQCSAGDTHSMAIAIGEHDDRNVYFWGSFRVSPI